MYVTSHLKPCISHQNMAHVVLPWSSLLFFPPLKSQVCFSLLSSESKHKKYEKKKKLTLYQTTNQATNQTFNSLLNDKFLDWTELKAFADDKITVTENLKFVL